MKRWSVLLMLTAAVLMSGAVSIAATATKEKPLKVALILPGKKDDVSWNQAMYESAKALEKKLGDKGKVTITENVYEVADIEPALRDFASEGYDVIIGHGFQFMEPIIKVAEDFPKTYFLLGTGYKTLPNTCVYDVKLEEGGYLMGTMAGLLTKTNKIGVIGGCDVSEIYRGHEAFKYAAKQVNPKVEVQELYTGDWTDALKAKEGAISMYESGVDIIWHSGDGIGLGTVAAGKEKGKMVLTNVCDQNKLAPEAVVSGIVEYFTPAILQAIDDIQNNNFTNRKNKFYWLTFGNGGLYMAPFHNHDKDIPRKVKDKLAEVTKQLADGTAKMPHFDK